MKKRIKDILRVSMLSHYDIEMRIIALEKRVKELEEKLNKIT